MKLHFKPTRKVTVFLMLIFLLGPRISWAQEDAHIIIKDHRFSTAELTIPAGQKIKLTIVNQDPTSEEFESYELNREEIIDGNETITIFIGPLKAGKYEYFGEFHKETAQGVIVAQ